jgi:N-acetylglucosaminyldiphosphoundecaprenol N-acetyl-beta-D-mannosaminyltransferase
VATLQPNAVDDKPRQGCVLGTPLEITTYDDLIERCYSLCRREAPIAIDFSNTQIVTLRRHDPMFRELTETIDLFIPDGMPLVWCLNAQGAGMDDRVYGPTFMRQLLSTTSADLSHYLIGGSEECGDKLRETFKRINPNVRFVGGYHGKCDTDGRLESGAEEAVTEEMQRLKPDLIWIGLGTPKQYAWVKRHKHLFERGVILTVGFAFDVNAGTKPDAPMWMQRRGLTWVFRMASEPKRLLTRYFRYNTLFLCYLLLDSIRRRDSCTLER